MEQQEQLTRHAETDLRNAARMANLEQSREVAATREILVALSKLPVVHNPVRRPVCGRLFARFIEGQGLHYANLGVIGLNGRLQCSGLPKEGDVDLSDRAYFRRAIDTRGFASGGYQIGRVTGKASVNFGYPVVDGHGNVTGVVFAALGLGWLEHLVARLPHGDDAVVDVLDSRGRLLARYPDGKARIGKPIENAALLRAVQAGKTRGTVSAQGSDGVERLYSFSPLKGLSAGRVYLALGIPTHRLYGPVRERLERDALLMAVIAALILIVAWWGSEVLVLRPVYALRAAAEGLGRGNLAARTGIEHGSAELGGLARSFDRMAEEIERRTTELDRVNQALRALSEGNRTLLRARHEQTLLEEMCRVPVEVAGFPLAWIGYLNHDTQKSIEIMAHAGWRGAEPPSFTWADTPAGAGPTGQAARTGEPAVARDLPDDPQYGAWRELAVRYGVGSALSLPLHLDGQVLGVFTIYSDELDAFGDKEITLFVEMAQDLAFGIENLRLRDKHEQADAALKRMAYEDQLTGLPNRAELLRRLAEQFEQAKSQRKTLALIALDLNRFHEMNDVVGYEPGDAMLREVGTRLARVLGPEVTIARSGEDEFAVILPDCDEVCARRCAQELEAALSDPLVLDGLQLDMHATVGAALFPDHSDSPEELVRFANKAIIQARYKGSSFGVYVPESRKEIRRRLVLSTQLHQAIKNEELLLYGQPKVSFATGEICGLEALLRWSHPEHGMVPPAEFVQLAEQTGLIKSLTDWVMETAVRQSHAWAREDRGPTPIAVNLSAHNLRELDLAERLGTLLSGCGVDASQLHLELTESALMEDPARALRVLEELHEMGLALFIDDFGTGYSSLSYLQKLPVDAIKIDKSFVHGMSNDSDSAVIVRSTIELAHSLGLEVVAEGIEDQATWDSLHELGCDVAQGYFISRPMPMGEFGTWLDESPWTLGSSGSH